MRPGSWTAAALGALMGCAGEATPTGDAAAHDAADAMTNDLGGGDGGGADGGVPRCVPGMSVACACVGGGSGAQVCSAEGVYEACRCPDAAVPMDAPRPVPIPGPRLITPQSVSRAMTQRPTFRWVLPAGATRARVTLARDRALRRDVRTSEATGTSWRPTEPLPFAVWFWRVEAIGADGGVAWTSPTWEFRTPRRDSAVDSSWGKFRDFNGDGYDDLTVSTGRELHVYQGGPDGIPATPTVSVRLIALIRPGRWAIYGHTTGDFNGDGLTDLAYVLASTLECGGGASGDARRLCIHHGSQAGLPEMPDVVLSEYGDTRGYAYGSPRTIDSNGDGFDDLMVHVDCDELYDCALDFEDHPDVQGMRGYRLLQGTVVYAGGLGGLPAGRHTPVEESRGIWDPEPRGDLDGDGTADLIFFLQTLGRHLGLTGYRPQWHVPVNLSGGVSARPRAADVDGDGRPEVFLATFNRVHIFRTVGLPTGRLEPWVRLDTPEAPTGLAESEGFGATFRAGDVNGDGHADLLVGSPYAVSSGSRRGEGRAYLFSGDSRGMSEIRRWRGRTYASGQSEGFGHNLMIPGDLDGDGFDDMVIAADGWAADRIEVHRGAQSASDMSLMRELADIRVEFYYNFEDN